MDVIPYRATDARQPLRLKGKVGTVVAISSAAVYAGSDGHGLLDADDSDRPVSIAQIGQSVAALMDHQWKEVLFAGPPTPDGVGDSPWTTLKPSVLDMSAAREELGYRDVIRYEEALRRTCGMARANRPQPKVARRLPRAAEYYGGLFDYEEEDELAVRIKRSQSGSRRQP